ncbi:serine hydrolase domain-containing protein [Pedobacter sp. CFBP9032]|uniref:serine hydrolase domain-containing protein n=1 Tax=Pedobacter sp. CFBP9032 TaxID=3096539 RepID=UPI002A69E3C6|nr:serine hydrolase domain-containing protein [Pedobacter sp. CFBP9032]MDY0903305.1 serine hydrolase domain-containing protein [Pedobacter sp. CFBP9032]
MNCKKIAPIVVFLLSIIFNDTQAQLLNTVKLDSFFKAVSSNSQVMGSVLITKEGKSIYQKTIGYSQIDGEKKIPATLQTRYRIGSISKSFTAVMIFQLIEEKKISLDTKLSMFFSQLPNADRITIAHLLNHTSGLSDYVNENKEWITVPHTKEELLDKIAMVKPHFEPGAKQQYSNGGFLLLGYIIEKLTGQTYQAALKQRITDKIKLKNTIAATINNSQTLEARPYIFNGSLVPIKDIYFPNIVGVGDILSTPQDLSVFINSLANGKLVSTQSYNYMKTFSGNNLLGMGLLKSHFYEKILLGHNGGTSGSYSAMYMVPEDGVTFIITTNGMNYALNDVLLVLLKAYYNRPYEIPKQLKEEDLDELLGNYQSEEMPLKISITKSGPVLIAQASGQSAFSLDVINRNDFKREQFDVLMKFDRARHEMTLVQGGKSYRYVIIK